MTYTITLHPCVVQEDIPKLSKENKARIKKIIRKKLSLYPDVFGKPLRNTMKNCRALRVGDYRIVYRVQKDRVEVVAILHRSALPYEQALRRLSP